MGNGASSDGAAAPMQLKEELADMQRSLQALNAASRLPPVLPPGHLLLDGVTVVTRADVHVLLGPVVGKVGFQRARVLLEVGCQAVVTAHVSALDAISNTMVELPQHQCTVQCPAGRPAVFLLDRLVPGKRYCVTFGGIRAEDVAATRASFCMQTLECGSVLKAIVVSGDNPYERESGEANLWIDVKKRVEDRQVQTVLHLGGQVALERMFDQSVQLLMLYAGSSTAVRELNWSMMETKAIEVLRAAYRSQWTLSPAVRFVLANASNLMMWGDADVYPRFSTRAEFYLDHEQPTLRMQVIRTVTRCARRLFHEYQRQLWDDELPQLIERESEVFAVAEKALASTGQIFRLSQQIPRAAEDVELQKKRHDIEGARRAEKHFRALEAEKTKLQKQLVSFNQLLAPQRGEEFCYEVGQIGVLFLDLRSGRMEPGGAQAAENDLLSTMQWRFIEETLERDNIRTLVVCSEVPLVDDIAPDVANAGASSAGVMETVWAAHEASQARLLSMLFDWKLQLPNRQFIVVAGTSGAHYFGRMRVKDTRLRTEAEQVTVGAVSAAPCHSTLPRRSGSLHGRFEFEHSGNILTERCFLELKLESGLDGQTSVMDIARVGIEAHDEELANVLLGPVVGWVDDSCAVILLEVDREADVVCQIVNPLTNESRRVFQHFHTHRANSFFIPQLRAGHFYRISFGGIKFSDEFQASFTTTPRYPKQFDVVALCNEAKTLSLSAVPDTSTKESRLWHALAEQAVEMPFVTLNLTLHLGGQFFPDSDAFVHEALIFADNNASSDLKSTSVGYETRATVELLEKLRQMYRMAWNAPGTRQALAHGAHVMLTNENDNLSPSNQDYERQHIGDVRTLLSRLHIEYQNLLLPPSKRLGATEVRACKPLHHSFGAVGLFVLPVGDLGGVGVHEVTWQALEAFLMTPRMSQLLLVTTEAVVEDSLEDVMEKASVDPGYRRRLGFFQRDFARLFDMLFDWQRTEREREGQSRKQAVLLGGNRFRSFDSVIREVCSSKIAPPLTAQSERAQECPALFQFIVGPLCAPSAEIKNTVDNTVLAQGSLLGKYTYHHAFLREKPVAIADDAPPSIRPEPIPTTPAEKVTTVKRSTTISTEVTSQLLHLSLAVEDDLQLAKDSSADPSDSPAPVPAIRCCFVSQLPIESEGFPDDEKLDKQLKRPERVSCCNVGIGGSSEWQLPSVPPPWLQELLAEPLREEKEIQVNERLAFLHGQHTEIQTAFQRDRMLSAGLVTLSNAKTCAAKLTESFESYHQLSGSSFQAMFPQAPSRFVVAYTIQKLQTAEPPVQQIAAAGAIELVQYSLIFQHSFTNSWLFDLRLQNFWG